jgi:hypothetical protein
MREAYLLMEILNPRKVIIIAFCAFVTCSFLLIIASAEEGLNQRKSKKAYLIVYKKKLVMDYLNKLGYSDVYPDKIERNSSGTRLYLRDFKDNILLSISGNGKIKEFPSRARFIYLNEKEEIVAWYDDIKKGIHFRNAAVLAVPLFTAFGIDPGGKFFFVSKNEGVIVDPNGQQAYPSKIEPTTSVASVNDPLTPLIKTRIMGERIFFKNGKIYLFARAYRNFRGPGDYEQHEIICQIFKNNGSGTFELEEEIHIHRPSPRSSPFGVIDMDLWSEKVLIEDVRDMPFSFLTSWYLYDLKLKKMTKIGRRKDGYAFFLQNDILGGGILVN